MYRGTTPTIKWKIKSKDFVLEDIKSLWMTFKSVSGPQVLLTKELKDVNIDSENKIISYTLTQEETLSFNVGQVDVQMRILMNNDFAFSTKIQRIEINRVLKGGVIK